MTATAYNNLAATYEGMGKYDKAEPLFQKGLKLFEDKLGPNHYKTGAALDNLGVLYREKGEYKKAESYALRAVEITEKARGPEHPETATCLNDLAKLYEAMGDKAKADPFRQRAAKIRGKIRLNLRRRSPVPRLVPPEVVSPDTVLRLRACKTLGGMGLAFEDFVIPAQNLPFRGKEVIIPQRRGAKRSRDDRPCSFKPSNNVSSLARVIIVLEHRRA